MKIIHGSRNHMGMEFLHQCDVWPQKAHNLPSLGPKRNETHIQPHVLWVCDGVASLQTSNASVGPIFCWMVVLIFAFYNWDKELLFNYWYVYMFLPYVDHVFEQRLRIEAGFTAPTTSAGKKEVGWLLKRRWMMISIMLSWCLNRVPTLLYQPSFATCLVAGTAGGKT